MEMPRNLRRTDQHDNGLKNPMSSLALAQLSNALQTENTMGNNYRDNKLDCFQGQTLRPATLAPYSRFILL